MKRKKIDLLQERTILIYSIISTEFLRQLNNSLNPKFFKTNYSKLIINWVLDYYKEFKESPNKNIQNIFYQKSIMINDEEDKEDIKEFLSSLSEEWKNTKKDNLEFVLKNSVNYLKLRSLELLKDKIENSIIEADPIKGEQAIATYDRVEKLSGIGISLFKDNKDIVEAFMEEQEILFKFPGVFGEVCGDFQRGDLVSFLAASKRGKSWFQLYLGETAARYGHKVILFSLEMTKRQILRRGWQSLTGETRRQSKILIPRFEEINTQKKKKYKVTIDEKEKSGVDVSRIKEEQIKLRKIFRTGDLRMVPLPAYSATVEDIEAYLDNLYYYENYIPDVIIVDYADIVAPSKNIRGEYRHIMDDIWKKLRKIAQERDSLVVTASQGNRASFSRDAKEEHIAEDIRKIAHVAKMISINKDKDDDKIKAVRIEQLAERDGSRNYKQALVLQCLEIARPYIDSKYAEEVYIEEEKE